MNIPTDALSGAPSFTIEVRKVNEAEYEAFSPSTVVPPSKGATEGDAIRAHSLALFDALCDGRAFQTESKCDA